MPTREVCETARAFRLPVLVDIVSRPEVVDMFAPEYPDVNFIIAHLGSFTDDWKAHQQVTYQLARYPNVYADTSGVRQFRYLVQAIQRGGARKLLFGSDGPWLHPGLELYKIRLLGLPPAEERLVLGGNILRLLRRARVGRDAAQIREPRSLRSEGGASRLINGAHVLESEAYREDISHEVEYKL
jgi:predicted TIM-barrel fold metal-dependent hydrolase